MPGQRDQNALTPRDLAERCEALGAEVVVNNSGKRYQVRPPNPDAGPVMFGTDAFRSNADRSDTIAHLRRAGLDVVGDPRLAPPTPKPSAMPARRANGVTLVPEPASPGTGRPTLTYGGPAESVTAQDESGPIETRREDPAGEAPEPPQGWAVNPDDVRAILDTLGELEDRIARLAERADDIASRTQGNASRGSQTDARLRELTRRVEAIESAPPNRAAEPVESLNDRFRREALAFLHTLPPTIYVPRVVISEALGITDETEIKALSQALRTLDEHGQVESTGTRSSVRWRAVREQQTDDQDGEADGQHA